MTKGPGGPFCPPGTLLDQGFLVIASSDIPRFTALCFEVPQVTFYTRTRLVFTHKVQRRKSWYKYMSISAFRRWEEGHRPESFSFLLNSLPILFSIWYKEMPKHPFWSSSSTLELHSPRSRSHFTLWLYYTPVLLKRTGEEWYSYNTLLTLIRTLIVLHLGGHCLNLTCHTDSGLNLITHSAQFSHLSSLHWMPPILYKLPWISGETFTKH